MEAHTSVADIGAFPRAAYSIAESEVLSGLSRASLYRLMSAGSLKTVLCGRRRLVPRVELERLCQSGAQP